MKSKQEENLDAKLEATIKATRARQKKTCVRCNWDEEPHFSLRQRVTDAWINKNDIYVEGDSMYSFCARTTVSRAVLSRYLPKRLAELKSNVKYVPGKRGRRSHLSESVMRHVCEGLNLD